MAGTGGSICRGQQNISAILYFRLLIHLLCRYVYMNVCTWANMPDTNGSTLTALNRLNGLNGGCSDVI